MSCPARSRPTGCAATSSSTRRRRERRRTSSERFAPRPTRPAASARSRNSAMPAPTFAARKPATSRARTSCSTAAHSRARSRISARGDPMRIVAAVLLALAAATASAQTYPSRAVKVVVPWPPGQATDIAARIIAAKLQESLGQPFVIDNKPGAGGAIGTEAVAKAPGDGYTLLAASSGPISIMPNLQKTPYDPLKDLAPVSVMCTNSFALVTRSDFPAANAKEFVALLKANPDKYSFSSSGTGATAHL